MVSFICNDFLRAEGVGEIDLDTDVIKAILVTSAMLLDDEDVNVGDNTLGELSGTGYVAGHGNSGRKTMVVTGSKDDPNNQAEFDAVDLTWVGINAGTIAGVLIVKEGSVSDADAKIVEYLELATPVVTNGGDVTIKWNAEGFLKKTRAAGS